MTYPQGILLGVIQGIAEFLPVSSSGHLMVLREIMGLGDVPKLFDILLHLATLIVVIFIYRKRIGRLLNVFFRFFMGKTDSSDKADLRMILLVLVSTGITGVVGFVFEGLGVLENITVAGIAFIATGLLLLTTRFLKPQRGYEELRFTDSLLVGAAQGVGTIPGISRSGITISAAMMGGMDRETAGEYSFIISLPAILGALILDLGDGGALLTRVAPGVLVVSFLMTLLVGYFSLSLLLRLLRKGSFFLFSFYLIPLGMATLILL